MANDTSTSKADVDNWRRGYEAGLSGKAFVSADDERTSAWRLGYRDGRALRLKQHVEGKQLGSWPAGQRQRRWCRDRCGKLGADAVLALKLLRQRWTTFPRETRSHENRERPESIWPLWFILSLPPEPSY
jgi:hypothetical protein